MFVIRWEAKEVPESQINVSMRLCCTLGNHFGAHIQLRTRKDKISSTRAVIWYVEYSHAL